MVSRLVSQLTATSLAVVAQANAAGVSDRFSDEGGVDVSERLILGDGQECYGKVDIINCLFLTVACWTPSRPSNTTKL